MSRPTLLQEIGDVALAMAVGQLVHGGISAASNAFNAPHLKGMTLKDKAKFHLSNIEGALRYGFPGEEHPSVESEYYRKIGINNWEARLLRRNEDRETMIEAHRAGNPQLAPIAPPDKYMIMKVPRPEYVPAPAGDIVQKVILAQRRWLDPKSHHPPKNKLDFIEQAAKLERSLTDKANFAAELRENLAAQKARRDANISPRMQKKLAKQNIIMTNMAEASMAAAKKYPPDTPGFWKGDWSPHQFAKYTKYRDRLLGR